MKSTAFLVAIFGLFLLTSCSKNNFCEPDSTQAPPSEIAQVEAYLNSNGITATKDGRGFYYIIKNEGAGKFATICSNVTVNYVGRLTNGTQFDSNNNISFAIRGLIKGWQQGIPLLKPGGSITLFIPPSLGYGSQATSSIPANSILIFEIDLLAIN